MAFIGMVNMQEIYSSAGGVDFVLSGDIIVREAGKSHNLVLLVLLSC